MGRSRLAVDDGSRSGGPEKSVLWFMSLFFGLPAILLIGSVIAARFSTRIRKHLFGTDEV